MSNRKTPAKPNGAAPNGGYSVGFRRPPKEHRFKPGQSGNPSGARATDTSLAADLEALVKRELHSTADLPRGQREQIVTKLAAGIQTLVDQFVDGDYRARRDLLAIAEKRGIDFGARRAKARRVDPTNAAEIRQALIDRGVPQRLLPPTDDGGLDPPPDPPLPPDAEKENDKQ
jgi:hypothetical protein